jgi:hypothetical protein
MRVLEFSLFSQSHQVRLLINTFFFNYVSPILLRTVLLNQAHGLWQLC